MKITKLGLFLAHTTTVGFLFGLALISSSAAQLISGAGVPLWTNRFNGTGNSYDQPFAMTVDGNGNVIVTGGSNTNDVYSSATTIEYSGAGLPLWTNCDSTGYIYGAQAVVSDSKGNVFVTGYGPTVKYSDAGLILWTNQSAYVITVDSSDNVFVMGDANLTTNSGGFRTIKYSNDGIPLWTNYYNGPGRHAAKAIVIDSHSDVIVTGYADGTDFYTDFATIKYSNAGVPLWTNRCGSAGFDDRAAALAVDSHDNVFVTGKSIGNGSDTVFYNATTVAYSPAGLPLWTNYQSTFTQYNAIAVDRSDKVFIMRSSGDGYMTIAYSNSGMRLWTNNYKDGTYATYGQAMAVDDSGNVFVTGYSNGHTEDYVTVGYSGAGVPLWTNRYNGPANSNDVACAIAVDPSGNVFVTGASAGDGSSFDYVTIKYSTSIRPHLDARRMANQLVLSWTNSGFSLQSAPSVTGPFTDVSATNSYTNVISDSQQYFRLKAKY